MGCVATGYYLVRGRVGQDIRELGSGSSGARNVGRVLGWSGFLLVLLGDMAKGAIAVWAARQFSPDDRLAGVAMLGVIAGHIWPAQLGFRGGKGVATSLGALLVYNGHLAVGFALLYSAGLILTRRSVLAGLLAFGGIPFISVWLGGTPARAIELSCVAALVLIAHRRNLVDIFAPPSVRREIASRHSARDL
jgi:glycerol-3-phosphate acyltransferase PlsY